MEAILWKLRTVTTWHDIPEEFCPWQIKHIIGLIVRQLRNVYNS
ncbi:hypothetical protein E0H86_09975 [Acinetobacter sp. ANC 4635]|nr:hypothetical protein E0H86_09975 [Acinetobacter sp. ANC 4635]